MAQSPKDTVIAAKDTAKDAVSSMHIPSNQSMGAKIASPLATISSTVDPTPHYLVGGACMTAGFYSWTVMKFNPLGIAGMLSGAMYMMAGYYLNKGDVKKGYDLGSLTSVGLMAASLPRLSRGLNLAGGATSGAAGAAADALSSTVSRAARAAGSAAGERAAGKMGATMGGAAVPLMGTGRDLATWSLAGLGSWSAIMNGTKSYQLRTGHPKEMRMKH